jgi:hypothetical protein
VRQRNSAVVVVSNADEAVTSAEADIKPTIRVTCEAVKDAMKSQPRTIQHTAMCKQLSRKLDEPPRPAVSNTSAAEAAGSSSSSLKPP